MRKLFIKLLIIVTTLTSMFAVSFMVGCGNSNSGNKRPPRPFQPPVTELNFEFNKQDANLLIGDTLALSILDKNAKKEKISYYSEDGTIATIDQNGNVEARGVGTTTVYAEYNNGDYTAECEVNVSLGGYLPTIYIYNKPETFDFAYGSQDYDLEFAISYNGKLFNDVDVNVESENTSIVSVQNNGKTLNIGEKGSTYVVISANWRGIEVTPEILTVNVKSVYEFYFNGKPDTSIKLYTADECDGKSYVNAIDFTPSFSLDNQVVSTANVQVEVEDSNIVEYNNSTKILSAKNFGATNVVLRYNDGDTDYSKTIIVETERPVAVIKNTVDYFSTYTNKFYDILSDSDKTLNQILSLDADEEIVDCKQGTTELKVENGYIDGFKCSRDSAEEISITVGTNKRLYKLNVNAYCLVIHSKEDLKNFEIKFAHDDHDTKCILEREIVKRIDGYCKVVKDIDCSGLTINHSALVGNDALCPFHDNSNEIYKSVICNHERMDSLGFSGVFDGDGHVLDNLTIPANGYGLFGYGVGGIEIKNVAFTNISCNYSSGMFFLHVPVTSSFAGTKMGEGLIDNVLFELSPSANRIRGIIEYGGWSRSLNVHNVIIDASKVADTATTEGTLGGLLTASGTVGNYNEQAVKEYENVYVISKNLPLNESVVGGATVKVYGANTTETNTIPFLPSTLSSGTTYKVKLNGVKTYLTKEDLIQDKEDNDYSNFNTDLWYVAGYPLFINANKNYVIPSFEGKVLQEGEPISVYSKENSKVLTLKLLGTGEQLTNVTYSFSSEINTLIEIDNNGAIIVKSTANVTSNVEGELYCDYVQGGNSGRVTVKVVVEPSKKTISDEIIISAKDGANNLADYIDLENINLTGATATQTINGETVNLTVKSNGDLVGAKSVVNSDRTGVVASTVMLSTTQRDYEFTNVKVYAKIIYTPTDLQVFEIDENVMENHNVTIPLDGIDIGQGGANYPDKENKINNAETAEDAVTINGYFILANNINMQNVYVIHGRVEGGNGNLSELRYYNNFYSYGGFYGVFDGQGNAISNFHPGFFGLFGALCADNENGQATVKNVAFLEADFNRDSGAGDITGGDAPLLAYTTRSKDDKGIIVENVHVTISDNHHISPATPRYIGLFKNVSSSGKERLKNIYVEFPGFAPISWGTPGDAQYTTHRSTIWNNDNYVLNTDIYNRTDSNARLDNVLTISQVVPSYHRGNSGWSNGFTLGIGTDKLYMGYAVNDIGREKIMPILVQKEDLESGLYESYSSSFEEKCGYAHKVFTGEDLSKGIVIYDNVYRFKDVNDYKDNYSTVSTNVDKFVATGLWVKDATTKRLLWKSTQA